MHHKTYRALAAASLMILAACADARLEKLTLGMNKEAVASAIGDAPHRTATYFTAGKSWDLQLYSRSSADQKDSIVWRKMSPVVFIDDKAVGWGWSWWSGEAAKEKIAMPENK